MKKYFAKYLPVEEKIKLNDSIIDTEWNKKYGVGIVTKIDKVVGMFHVKFPTLAVPVCANPKGCKKVKLFLCSRDIQIGDYAYVTDHPEKLRLVTKSIGLEFDEPTMQIGIDGFKVIGEISPEAVWVKEGDEFDEDEVGYLLEDNSVKPIGLYPGNYLIAIKSSHCKHFH